ncbi:unnamed protein product [Chrysoparadoxa australica]
MNSYALSSGASSMSQAPPGYAPGEPSAPPGYMGSNSSPAGVSNLLPPRWVPDKEATACAGCGKAFDMARRRHHCRCCGSLFCYNCSAGRALLPASFGSRDPQRVCRPCQDKLQPYQAELMQTSSNAVKGNSLSSGTMAPYMNSPVNFTLGAEIRKAAYSLLNFTRAGVISDKSIPQELLYRAKGLAFLTVLKAGFIFAGRFGTGLVVAKTANGTWSAPSAIGTIGFGYGVLIGGELTDVVLILNTQSAVDAFCAQGQFSVGAEVGAAVGPLGRTGAGAVLASSSADVAPIYTYSHSKGLFAGVSLEGAVISTRADVNHKFYGRSVAARELLAGAVPPPPAAQPLYDALRDSVPAA